MKKKTQESTPERRDFGHIFRKPGSRFLWVRYRVGGKAHVESSRSVKRRDAEKLLARRQAELGLGVFVEPSAQRVTFEDLCKAIRDEYAKLKRRSAATLEGRLARLAVEFAGVRAAAIDDGRLTAYALRREEQGAAGPTIRNELHCLRHAMRLKKVPRIPELPPLAEAEKRKGFFERDDFAALLAELPEALRAPVEFAYLSGWRKSEVLGLTWDRVDWDAGVVRLDVGTTKTGRGRTFPFGVLPRLRQVLDDQRTKTRQVERRTETIVRWVFHRNGAEIKDMFEAWTRACDRASRNERGLIVRPQLVGRLFHDLRRTAVRNLVRAGVPEHTAMKLSGHETRDVFDRYDIVSERDLSEGVAKLATFHQLQAASGDRFRWAPGDLRREDQP